MPESRPISSDMLAVVRTFLENELLPHLENPQRFECRVAINILGTVQRELEMGSQFNTEEFIRLQEILGKSDSIEELNRELAEQIRKGTLTSETPGMLEHLHQTTINLLKINNPKWLKP